MANHSVHQAFELFCQRAETEHGIAVGCYILMPDHVHLFVTLPAHGLTLAAWIQALRSVLGKRLVALGHQKPHWQEGFFDHVLRSGESYAQKWNYVQLNPVRGRLVANAEDWPYHGEILPLSFR